MQIIPVIDLMRGVAVRGRSGDRVAYRPVVSRLRGGEPEDLSDPVRLLRAYREMLRPDRVYVADLDRIAGAGDNHAAIGRLVEAASDLEILLDEGPVDDRRAGLTAAHRIVPIVATETLRSVLELRASTRSRPSADACFGLDLGRDRVLSRSPEVSALGARALLRLAARAGFRVAIVLLLDGVGTGGGLPRDRLRHLRPSSRALELFVAGGIATLADLAFLRSEGFAGALLATALHEGWIRPADLRKDGA